MAGDLRLVRASVTFEESPAEDPEGPFRDSPCFKILLSLAFSSPAGGQTPTGARFLLGWSTRLIFLGHVMRTIDRTWKPEIGVRIPDNPVPLDLQFRLVLYRHVAEVLRRRHAEPRIGKLEVRATVIGVEPIRPAEYAGDFTFYTKRTDRTNVEFSAGSSTSTMQITEK